MCCIGFLHFAGMENGGGFGAGFVLVWMWFACPPAGATAHRVALFRRGNLFCCIFEKSEEPFRLQKNRRPDSAANRTSNRRAIGLVANAPSPIADSVCLLPCAPSFSVSSRPANLSQVSSSLAPSLSPFGTRARRTRLFLLNVSTTCTLGRIWRGTGVHPREDNHTVLVSLRLPIPARISSRGLHALCVSPPGLPVRFSFIQIALPRISVGD